MTLSRIGQLALAALLIANLVVQAARLAPAANAATKHQQYKVVPYTEANREDVLNKFAGDGWELVAVDPKFGGFILERE
jgi:hypothetical protein